MNMTTLCTNAKTGSATEYANYGFESFCRAPDGKYYGVKADGLYLLEGNDDAGTSIDSLIDYGDLDFGTSALKRIATAYTQVASGDRMELRITQEGVEYEYAARSYSEELQAQRFDTGKGLRANFFGVKIANTEGCDFTLDSVELAAVETGRRI